MDALHLRNGTGGCDQAGFTLGPSHTSVITWRLSLFSTSIMMKNVTPVPIRMIA